MFDQERQDRILKILNKKTSIRVTELGRLLGVSEATVRRDLEKLTERGQIRRTHGGATLIHNNVLTSPVVQREYEKREEKRRIGRAAAALIRDGEAVFIGSGTTTLEVARSLSGRRNITVITNALTVINTLAQQDGISIVATGGLLTSQELSFIGHLTEQALHELRPHKIIMGIGAIHLERGLTDDSLPEISTARVIFQAAPEVILVADHSKFNKVSTAFVAPIHVAHKLVTDDQAPGGFLDALRAMGIEILLC